MPAGNKARAWRLAAAALLGAATTAHGGDLRLEPVSLHLRAGDDSVSLWLDNTGDGPLQAQARLFSWNQEDGGEVLAATTDLAVSPPSLAVPRDGRQRIRLVRLRPGAPAVETAYRLIVDELSRPDLTTGARPTARRRYSIPVFVRPATPGAPPRLSAGITEDRSGKPVLRLANSGGYHARVAALTFVDAGGRHVLAPRLAGYVLAGRYKDWPLPDATARSPHGRVEAEVNGEAVVLVPEAFPPASR